MSKAKKTVWSLVHLDQDSGLTSSVCIRVCDNCDIQSSSIRIPDLLDPVTVIFISLFLLLPM